MAENGVQYIDEDEIDLREIFKTLKYRKWSILFVTLLVTLLSALYAWYTPNVYQAKSTIQIESEKKGSTPNDILAEAMSGGTGSNLDTEKEVIKSRFLVEKVVKKLQLQNEYYGRNKWYKKRFFYRDTPLRIALRSGEGLTYTISPKSDNTFELEVKGKDSSGQKIDYEHTHRYGEPIRQNAFDITISKEANSTLDLKSYTIVTHDPRYFADTLRSKHLTVATPSKKADILAISYTDNVPLRAKEFIDVLTKEYMRQSLERKTKEATFTLAFVNKQLKIISTNLKAASSKLEKFKQENKTIDVKESITQLSQQMAEYQKEKSILDLKLQGIKDLMGQVKHGKLETLTLAGIGIEDQSIGGLISSLQKASIQKNELLKEFTSAHPDVKKVNATIRQTKKILARTIRNILRNLNRQKKTLTQQISSLQTKLKTLPKQEQDYIGLERNFMFNQKFYTYLMEKKTETEIKKAATISKNRILDLPLLPRKPIKPKRKLIVIVGLLVGLILGMLLAFVRNFLDNTVKEESDVEALTNAPLLGIVPHFKEGKTARTLMVLDQSKSPVAEAFRNIRTNLQFMIDKDKSQVIAVTSTVAGEGKTSISSNLAGTMHLLKKKTVIINLDLRKPTLHTVFEVSNTKGASNYLSGNIDASEVIHKTKYEYIDVIPAGPTPPNPNELIASDRMDVLLDELRRSYDIIIIDTPPIGLVADTKMILHRTDMAVYTVRANYSKKEYFKLINELYADHTKLSVVLNDAKGGGGGYGYGYGDGYGYY